MYPTYWWLCTCLSSHTGMAGPAWHDLERSTDLLTGIEIFHSGLGYGVLAFQEQHSSVEVHRRWLIMEYGVLHIQPLFTPYGVLCTPAETS